MITVAILINGNPIIARSAVNKGKRDDKDERTLYITDAGVKIYHNRDEGAVALAKKILDTIQEQ